MSQLIKKGINHLVENPSEVEVIKNDSSFLYGTLIDSIKEEISDGINKSDQQIIKFHGMYQQDDRDIRQERLDKFLEPDYTFMIRLRLPAGRIGATQWLGLSKLARQTKSLSIRLTSRQAIQFHGVKKYEVKNFVREYHTLMLDSIAACGDVNRNVMCTPYKLNRAYPNIQKYAKLISEHLLPKTTAYNHIWLEDITADTSHKSEVIDEPIYGKHYLPRKFKIGIAIPPYNDVDVYTQDIGIVAITKEDEIEKFQIIIGGGMGSTLGDKTTWPKLGDTIGCCLPSQLVHVVETIVTMQRDYGNRSSRKHARLKYTIANMGLEKFVKELEYRCKFKFENSQKIKWVGNGDWFGWNKNYDNSWSYTLFIPNGRIRDTKEMYLLKTIDEIGTQLKTDFCITPNQNLIVDSILEKDKKIFEKILKSHGLLAIQNQSSLYKNSMACVALNTCPLAKAESERYLMPLLQEIAMIQKEQNLEKENIAVRISGCSNGCSRPYLSNISLVGTSLGRYNMYIGGNALGTIMAKPYKTHLNHTQILATIRTLLQEFKNQTQSISLEDFLTTKVANSI